MQYLIPNLLVLLRVRSLSLLILQPQMRRHPLLLIRHRTTLAALAWLVVAFLFDKLPLLMRTNNIILQTLGKEFVVQQVVRRVLRLPDFFSDIVDLRLFLALVERVSVFDWDFVLLVVRLIKNCFKLIIIVHMRFLYLILLIPGRSIPFVRKESIFVATFRVRDHRWRSILRDRFRLLCIKATHWIENLLLIVLLGLFQALPGLIIC